MWKILLPLVGIWEPKKLVVLAFQGLQNIYKTKANLPSNLQICILSMTNIEIPRLKMGFK